MDTNLAEYLTCDQLAKAVKSTPEGKASGTDAIAAKVLEIDSNFTTSIMLPFLGQSSGLE